MKQIKLLVLCAALLCGCTKGDVPNEPKQNQTASSPSPEKECAEAIPKEDYTGFWSHSEYPAAYYVIVTGQKDDRICLEITATRDDGFQIASAEAVDVQLVDGKGSFPFEDSFGNIGKCQISISEHALNLLYTTEAYQGWCIDAGEGTYRKEDRIYFVDFPDEGDLTRSSSFYATVPRNRYGGCCEEYAYAPEEFLLWLSPMELTEEGVFIRENSIALPYIVSDTGNQENLSILSGGNDGEAPYGDRVFYFTTDELGEIVDVIPVDDMKIN